MTTVFDTRPPVIKQTVYVKNLVGGKSTSLPAPVPIVSPGETGTMTVVITPPEGYRTVAFKDPSLSLVSTAKGDFAIYPNSTTKVDIINKSDEAMAATGISTTMVGSTTYYQRYYQVGLTAYFVRIDLGVN